MPLGLSNLDLHVRGQKVKGYFCFSDQVADNIDCSVIIYNFIMSVCAQNGGLLFRYSVSVVTSRVKMSLCLTVLKKKYEQCYVLLFRRGETCRDYS